MKFDRSKIVKFNKREIVIVVMVLIRAILETTSAPKIANLGLLLRMIVIDRSRSIPVDLFMSCYNAIVAMDLRGSIEANFSNARLRTHRPRVRPKWCKSKTGEHPYIGEDKTLASASNCRLPTRDVMISLVDEFLAMKNPIASKQNYYQAYYDTTEQFRADDFYYPIKLMVLAYRFDIVGSFFRDLSQYVRIVDRLNAGGFSDVAEYIKVTAELPENATFAMPRAASKKIALARKLDAHIASKTKQPTDDDYNPYNMRVTVDPSSRYTRDTMRPTSPDPRHSAIEVMDSIRSVSSTTAEGREEKRTQAIEVLVE